MVFEAELLGITISFPLAFTGLNPVYLVLAIKYFSFQQSAISCILTRQIPEFIQLVDTAQINSHIKRQGICPILCVPDITRFREIEQMGYFKVSLILTRHFTFYSANGKLQRIIFCLCSKLTPIGNTILID